MRKTSRKPVGTVLIEILIIVAMIGIILAVLLPNLMDGLNKAKQKRVVADIYAIATAMMSYYTDMEGAAAAGAVVQIGTYDKINHKNLAELLVPNYLDYLPFKDAWGHPFDYYFGKTTTEYGWELAFGVRSRGRDGKADDFAYRWGAFPPTQYHRDIVWLDGLFVTWPGFIEGDVNWDGDLDCNQGVGNLGEGCDPGNSNNNQNSNDETPEGAEEDTGPGPGNPGRGGGKG